MGVQENQLEKNMKHEMEILRISNKDTTAAGLSISLRRPSKSQTSQATDAPNPQVPIPET